VQVRALVLAAAMAGTTGCAARHAASGVVVAVSPDAREVTISHDAMPGYMDAMVMPFAVSDPALLDGVAPGDRVQFRLSVSRSRSLVDRLRIVSAARPDAGRQRSPAAPVLVPVGGRVPDFSLVDQRGETVTLYGLRGHVVLVTFIYSRCPLPDYCPRLMLNFGEVKRQFADRVGRDLTLLTITFDPKHDTSEVLARYGESFGAEGRGWRLLTGPPAEIQRITEAFGIEFWPEEGLITHTLQTAVIDRGGRLFATIEGKDYSLRQLTDVVQAAMDWPSTTNLPGTGPPGHGAPRSFRHQAPGTSEAPGPEPHGLTAISAGARPSTRAVPPGCPREASGPPAGDARRRVRDGAPPPRCGAPLPR
jgi:protein SCO1/2